MVAVDVVPSRDALVCEKSRAVVDFMPQLGVLAGALAERQWLVVLLGRRQDKVLTL